MREFKSYMSYQHFVVSVSKRWRFTRDTEQTDFLETVLATSADKAEELQAGVILHRAQVGHDWEPEDVEEGAGDEGPAPFSTGRMKPLRDRGFEGRVNPKGMPCLYVATHEETAIAEVRAWVGALVSVAQLKTSRSLKVVNCTTNDHRIMVYGGEPDAAERERAVWRDIDRAFSRPVTASEDLASYVPTQVLAEVFRRNGFDGVAYRSSLGPGHNLALFDLDAANVINCTLVQIDHLKLTYSQAANRYFVAKH